MARRTVMRDAKGRAIGERPMTQAERDMEAERLDRAADAIAVMTTLPEESRQSISEGLRQEARILRSIRSVSLSLAPCPKV